MSMLSSYETKLHRARERGLDISQCYDEGVVDFLLQEADKLKIPLKFNRTPYRGKIVRYLTLNVDLKSAISKVRGENNNNIFMNPLPVKLFEMCCEKCSCPVFSDAYYSKYSIDKLEEECSYRDDEALLATPDKQTYIKRLQYADYCGVPSLFIMRDLYNNGVDINKFVSTLKEQSKRSKFEILQECSTYTFINPDMCLRNYTYKAGASMTEYQLQYQQYYNQFSADIDPILDESVEILRYDDRIMQRNSKKRMRMIEQNAEQIMTVSAKYLFPMQDKDVVMLVFVHDKNSYRQIFSTDDKIEKVLEYLNAQIKNKNAIMFDDAYIAPGTSIKNLFWVDEQRIQIRY